MNSSETTNCRMPSSCRRRAFTLLELMISILVSSILMIGLGSAIFIATQATDPDLGALRASRQSGTAAFDVMAELQQAQSFTVRMPTTVEFAVADRTGDASPETIRYAWTGSPGDPLTRQLNGGTVVDVVENVHDFHLNYQTKTVTSTETQSVVTPNVESMFANFEGWSGITPTYNDYNVGPTNWCAEFFNANGLPSNTSKVTITRCQLMLKQGSGGNITVAIHRTVGGGNPQPHNNPLGTPVTVPVSTLPTTYQWVEVNFSDVTLSNLDKEFVIVVAGDTANAAQVQYLSSSSAPKDDPVMVWSIDAGTKWSPKKNAQDDNDMYFRVWGTYETTGIQTVPVTRYFLNSTGLKIQVGAGTISYRQTGGLLLNRPEVSSP